VDGNVAVAARCGLPPACELRGRVEQRPSLDGQGRVDVVRSQPMQDNYIRILGHGPELLGFGPGRYEELAAPGFVQRAHRLARTKAISIGLDRRTGRHPRAILE